LGGDVLELGGDIAPGFQLLAPVLQKAQVAEDALILFIFQQVLYQFLTGVNFIALLIFFGAGQQHLGFDAHERGRRQNEFTRYFHVELLELGDIIHEIVGDLKDRDVMDIQLIPLNKEKQQIKRAFKEG
jgi:hypothetical protein